MKTLTIQVALFSILLAFALVTRAEASGFTQNADGTVTAPDGMVWYPATKAPDGRIVKMTQKHAMTCCNKGPKIDGYPTSCTFGANGTFLPSKGEFQTLSDQLGYTPLGGNPTPNLVPDLNNQYFWSSSPDFYNSENSWYFSGYDGNIYNIYRSAMFAVRCVGN